MIQMLESFAAASHPTLLVQACIALIGLVALCLLLPCTEHRAT